MEAAAERSAEGAAARSSSPELHPALAQPGDSSAARTWEADAHLAACVAGHAPLRRALARIAARLVSIRAWERLGFASLRDYASERAGRSDRQIYELARGDAALQRLPRVEAAFVSGRISWTRARLLGRVPAPVDEARWLDVATHLSAAELAREVRAVDREALEAGGTAPDLECAAESGEARPRETVTVRCSRGAQGRWYVARQLAQRIAGERLPHDACAEAVAAEVLSAIGLEVEPEASARGRGLASAPSCPAPALPAPAAPGPSGAAPIAAASALLDALVAGLDDADPFELDARLRRAVSLEQRWEARLGPWLLDLAEGRRYRELGFRSFDQYARERLDLAPSKARALLRLERTCRTSAPFREAWRRGRLSWTRAHALVPLLLLADSKRWHAAWIERAGRVSVRRLEDDVEFAIASERLDPAALPPLPAGLPTGAEATLADGDPDGGDGGGGHRLSFTASRDVAHLFRAVLATVRRRIERATGRPSSEARAFDAMLEHVFEAWGRGRPVPRKYRIFARDGWRCTAPGCRAYRNLQDHHIVFRAAGGSDATENRTTLCAWHHLRGIHAGVVRCTGRAPDGLRFDLGVRASGPALASYRAGDLCVAR